MQNGCRWGRACVPPHPGPLSFSQGPSFHFLALLYHHSNTPKPPSPAASLFSELVKAYEMKLSIRWESLVTACNTENSSPWSWEWQSPGSCREGGPGRWGWLLTEATFLSCMCCLCRWPIGASYASPANLVLGLWEEGRKRTALPWLPGVGIGNHPWGLRSQGQSTLRLICLWLIKRRLYN